MMCDCVSAMGAGKSKKEAKHAAARALIEKLAESSLAACIDVQPIQIHPLQSHQSLTDPE